MAQIYSHTSAFHDIDVTDHDFLRVLSFGPDRQSSMYLDAPYETDFEYPNYFHLALAIRPDATRTLAIGLGGGTVVKRMWRDYPAMHIDAVELDPVVVDVAERFFALPTHERIRVFVDDGRHFLETHTDIYDIVIVDAFLGDAVPPPLVAEEFMSTLHDRLTPGGAVVFNFMGNVAGEGSEPFRKLHQALAAHWRRVWVFVINESTESGATNLILLATDSPLSTDEVRTRIADRVGSKVSVPAFHLFGQDLYEGEIG